MASRNSMPSLAALLGLLAVAGYQNRDKIGQILQGAKSGTQGGGFLDELGKMFGGNSEGGSQGGSISTGLDDLLNKFKNAGQNETADSWVNPEVPTQGLSPSQVEAAIGQETLQDLAAKTGISYDDLLDRLSKSIPDAVDKMTPEGKHPQNEDQARQWLTGLERPA
jgi:uncharacterized protein YidB (DUF937 family)